LVLDRVVTLLVLFDMVVTGTENENSVTFADNKSKPGLNDS